MNFSDQSVNLWKVIYSLITGGLNDEALRLKKYIQDNTSKEEEKT